ncbi:MAG: ATP-binding protein [Solirubrobacteraceae bacterium]
MPAKSEHFTVDTGLFRELGELLVGRDSTALVELIKNAYDADATAVTVVGQDLGDPDEGLIVVSDDGNGMTVGEFRRGFLRVASRLKSGGNRRSSVYGRRFTGAKGIGRLAAHKLASQLRVDSWAVSVPTRHGSSGRVAASRIRASIDWDEVERHETVEDVGDAISLASSKATATDQPGTTIRLSALRRRWTDRERTRFVREVSTFQPGEALREPIAPDYVERTLLFERPRTRESNSDPGFEVSLGGEFDVGEDYSVDVLAAASWVIEVQATKRRVRYAVAPTLAYAGHEGLDTRPRHATMRRDRAGAVFQARIFVRSGAAPKGLGDAYGVRVYMEGFRVLPYGEPGDDWLDVNRRYALRGRTVPFRGELEEEEPPAEPDREAGLVAAPLRNIFGGVFLTETGAPRLRMLVNREGFVPDETFLDIADTVSNGLALQTRLSAALRPRRREPRRARAVSDGAPEQPEALQSALTAAIDGIHAIVVAPGVSPTLRDRLEQTESQLASAQRDVIDEQAMLRVLASLGTQTAAFVHEINAALGSIASLKRAVEAMLQRPPNAQDVARLRRRVDALQRTIERQSAYLVEVVSRDARRRRSRRRYAEHFEISSLLLQNAAERERVTIENEIPPELKTPPMFPAEVTSLFTNLLSNAIKAAGRRGAIRANGVAEGERVHITIENTGVRVDPVEGEQWFDPYRSSAPVVNPALGQGMGLGLTITRAMLTEYRGTIAFAEADPPFTTAVRVTLPA